MSFYFVSFCTNFKSSLVKKILQEQEKRDGVIAAICAGNVPKKKIGYNLELRGCLYGRRDRTFAGTGRQKGSRHACIYLLFVPFRLYGKNFAGTFFVPSRQKRDNFYHINAPSRFAGTIL